MRRAGLVGGVVSALALGGAAAPAMADNTNTTSPAPAAAPLALADSAQLAAAAIEQNALDASLAAAKERAAAEAAEDAAKAKKSADAKAAKARAAAAAKAARERAAAASRASARAKLTARPAVASAGSAGSSSSSSAATPTATTTAASAPASSSKVDQLITFLKAQLGKPYVYGATGPGSYDCSGLTQAAFASVGVDLPRTSQEQSTVGTPVPIGSLQAGDLIFWGGEGSAYHVGVFIGDGQYLDAANPSTPVAIHQLADYMPDWAVRAL
ncbi:C40 family peptidase [Streptomyces sp. NBC_01476]|uniref:C40 family peptidase n=1 Tax=Streptomyces sp. NBC_01476 TaxID=2903881 RepID=UPI002E32B410|nr:C40 family peptidase [Streptomyces sp. NBC_01476]